MIFADKLIELRKKNGWSQEELAEKLEVSRQSVSKWEGAQSVPDINRILMLSDLFGVSVDYLLKDELDEENDAFGAPRQDGDTPLRKVSLSETQDFLRYRETAARRISFGVLLCILSPIALILLSVMREAGRLTIGEQATTGIGLLALIIAVGAAVALFVLSGIAGKKFEYLSSECFETEYGVTGFLRERREREQGSFVSQLVSGIVLCVVSVIPIFVAMILPGSDGGSSDLRYAAATCVLLAVVAAGVWLIVRASIRRGSYEVLLEEGDYSRSAKTDETGKLIAGVYWGVVTAGYLAYSFITMDWQRSWIVWPVAAVLYGVIVAIYGAVSKKDK